jgi:hypothetical protein
LPENLGLDETGTSDLDVSTPEKGSFDFEKIGQDSSFDWTPEPHYFVNDVWVP